MHQRSDKRRSSGSRGGPAGGTRYAAASAPRLLPIWRTDFSILAIPTAMALAFVLSQGCAAVGVSLLGAAAATATKSGVSYSMDSRAQKTFTAPMAQVKASLLAALGEMAFPVEADEKTEVGQRIVARLDEREVEVELESVTPKATKLVVIVHQGWLWKDRATAEEIIDQTGRGVTEAVVAARAGRGGARPAGFQTPAEGELRPAATLLDPWDPQRWRDGFTVVPTPVGSLAGKIETQAAKPERAAAPASPASPSIVALGGGRAPAPEGARPTAPPGDLMMPAALARMDAPSNAGKTSEGADNRWRVIRSLRLRVCPGTECAWGAVLNRGDMVVRLRQKDEWCRVWLGSRNVVGWVLADELAPQSWWDPPQHSVAASSP